MTPVDLVPTLAGGDIVEAGKFAVRAALYTTEQIYAVVAAHKRGA